MDRMKYGRKLTFMNAYFSLSIAILGLCGILIAVGAQDLFNPIWFIWMIRVLLNSAWTYCWQIIKQRAGITMVDQREVRAPSSISAFWKALFRGVGIGGGAALAFLFLSSIHRNPIPESELLYAELMLSLAGVWAFLWLDRAVWEWRSGQGNTRLEEYAERVEEEAMQLPASEIKMRRYIEELGRLARIGPWVGGALIFTPCIFLALHSWSYALVAGCQNILILATMSTSWKRARLEREVCQKELGERLAVSVPLRVPAVEQPASVYQRIQS